MGMVISRMEPEVAAIAAAIEDALATPMLWLLPVSRLLFNGLVSWSLLRMGILL